MASGLACRQSGNKRAFWSICISVTLGIISVTLIPGGCGMAALPVPQEDADRSNLPLTPSYTYLPPLLDPNVIDDPSDDEVLGWTPEDPTQDSLTSISGKPGGLSATASPPSQVELVWSDNSSDETGFTVQRNVNRTGWEEYAQVDANATAFVDTAVEPAIRHCYRVTAFNETESSAASTQVCLTLPTEAELTDPEDPVSPEDGSDELAPAEDGATKPDAKPTAVKVALLPDSQIQVTWTCTATNEDGFDVSRYNSKTKWIDAGSTAADATEFIDTTAEAGSSYCYRIRAYNTVGTTSYSTTKCVSIPAEEEPDDPPDTLPPNDPPPPDDPYANLPGGTYYVAPDGHESNDGTRNRPWPSVGYALLKVGGGTTILLKPGTYAGPIVIRKMYSGTQARPTLIRSEYKWQAVVANSPGHGVVTEAGTDWLVIDGLQVTGCVIDGIKINGDYGMVRNCWLHHNLHQGISSYHSTGFTCERNLAEHNGTDRHDHGIYASGRRHTYRSNVLRRNAGHGLHLWSDGEDGAAGCLISDNLCYSNVSRGIIVDFPSNAPDEEPNQIVGNTCVYNGADGIATVGGSSLRPTIVANNISHGNGIRALGVYPLVSDLANPNDSPSVWVDYNLFDADPRTAPDQQFGKVIYGANNRIADPRFADVSSMHFYLKSTSPAIGAGTLQYRQGLDFWSRPRLDNPPDLGAFPFVASPPTVAGSEPLDWWVLPE